MTVKTESFNEDVLQAHNQYRKKHNTPQVTWSDDLAKKAQKWANQIAKKGKFQHSPPKQRKGEGENIASAGGKDLTGEDAVAMWYDEIKDYDFTSEPTYNPKCGHFTQLIWKDTKEIGAGRAKGKNGMTYVVCRYGPSGNNLNTFPDNINAPGQSNVNTASADNIPSPANDVEQETPDSDRSQTRDLNNAQSPRKQKNTILGRITFEKKFIESEEDNTPSDKPKLKTSEVVQYQHPISKPAYRNNSYLEPAQPYHVTHYCCGEVATPEERESGEGENN